MELGDYARLKAAGRANLMKVNASYAIAAQRMKPDGTDDDVEMIAIGRKDVDSMKADLLAKVAVLDAIIKEMDALG